MDISNIFQNPHIIIFSLSVALFFILIAISYIDFATRRIPNYLTLPLFVAGIVATLILKPELVLQHVLAALIGFCSFFLLNEFYRKVKNRAGLGGGDAKLFGSAGAWLGYQGLPSLLLIASISGLVFVLAQSIFGKKIGLESSIAFGPHLALGFFLTWILGPLHF